jgi:mannose-1-phosphate guanylyltransferase / phosphomannomutase
MTLPEIPKQVVILCGGKGTRMGDLTLHIPKPMVALAGKPILEHQLDLARRYSCQEIILLTGYLGEVIQAYFRDGSDRGLRLQYHREDVPLGTAGALKEIEDRLDENFFVFYGDTMMDIDLARLADFHLQRQAQATLVVHPNHHPDDSDLLDLDAAEQVTAFYPKPRDPTCVHRNLANAALYVLSRDVLRHAVRGQFADLVKDVFPKALRCGARLLGYNTPEYITDVGTPERLRAVEADVLSGKVARLNRRHPRPAVFLDRDGVLNVDADPVARGEQLQLLPGVAEAIRRINRSEHLAIVVTNQPAIAKGFLSETDLAAVHAALETMIGREHAFVDRIYYCPHHPDKGFAGERPEYKIACKCRKPAPGMLLAAAAELNIDLSRSYMIGDRSVDILAGAEAGCKTVLVGGRAPAHDRRYPCRPDFICKNIAEAVGMIFDG